MDISDLTSSGRRLRFYALQEKFTWKFIYIDKRGPMIWLIDLSRDEVPPTKMVRAPGASQRTDLLLISIPASFRARLPDLLSVGHKSGAGLVSSECWIAAFILVIRRKHAPI